MPVLNVSISRSSSKKHICKSNISIRTDPQRRLPVNFAQTRTAPTSTMPSFPVEPEPDLKLDSVNPRVLETEYAVRGELVMRATAIQRDLEKGKGSYPFKKLVWCNVGNPQRLGQQPITWMRQILSLLEYPQMMDSPLASELFPEDVLKKAKKLKSMIPGGVGAYSESAGVYGLRQMVADGISRRDGYPASADDIFFSDGASGPVHYLMTLLLRDKHDGMMVPIPQYPLYSATLTLYGGSFIPYYLQEEKGWGLDITELEQQLHDTHCKGGHVRALVVINPGNPTGQCLTRSNMEDIIRFCHANHIMLIADEVYQTNIYQDVHPWESFKKVACELGLEGQFPLASLHSISKGFVGECGRRGGYMELTGVHETVRAQYMKLLSVNLCPNVSGQICASLMMNPPQPGEPSYELYAKERDSILGSLRRRAGMVVDALNKMEGVACNPVDGALYAFPSLTLPPRATTAAADIGKQPDWLYCKELLEEAGIVLVPGSGFGQVDGTFHFRTTLLPPEEDIAAVCDRLAVFHASFLKRYGGKEEDVNRNGESLSHPLDGC